MSVLQLYAVVSPVVALALVGGLGVVLLRRDRADLKSSLLRTEASSASSQAAEDADVDRSKQETTRGTSAAMATLAEAIQGLVAHMRNEQQLIREWADGQGEQNREIRKLLERIAVAREDLSRVR